MTTGYGSGRLWNALVRTHHIRSRKKVAKLRDACHDYKTFALLKSGAPGLMYVEGYEDGVKDWIADVQVSPRHVLWAEGDAHAVLETSVQGLSTCLTTSTACERIRLRRFRACTVRPPRGSVDEGVLSSDGASRHRVLVAQSYGLRTTGWTLLRP